MFQIRNIGDRVKDDIQGAKAVGMKTIYVSPNPENDVPCDLKVKSMKELLELFLMNAHYIKYIMQA